MAFKNFAAGGAGVHKGSGEAERDAQIIVVASNAAVIFITGELQVCESQSDGLARPAVAAGRPADSDRCRMVDRYHLHTPDIVAAAHRSPARPDRLFFFFVVDRRRRCCPHHLLLLPCPFLQW